MEKRIKSNKRFTAKGSILSLLSIYLIFAVFSGDNSIAFSRSPSTDRSLADDKRKELPSKSNTGNDSERALGTLVGDPNLSAWVVIYDHFARNQGETEMQMLSYEMFHNREVYQKILYVWDSSQADDIDYLNRYIPQKLKDDIITIDIATEMSALSGIVDIKADFATAQMSNSCFGRGRGYCEMLYVKMNLDAAVHAAAQKYEIPVPHVMGIADGDAYWMSPPVKDNVIDPAGRIIFHTIECGDSGGYRAGVEGLLNAGEYKNGMAAFPIHIWMDTLPAMRQKIVDIAHQKSGGLGVPDTFHQVYARHLEFSSDNHASRKLQEPDASSDETFLDVYVHDSAPVCEFCVMATYASIFEAYRYRFTQDPCPTADRKVAPSNAFIDASSDPLPMVYLMRHEKSGGGPIHPRFPQTLDIWVYGCCLTYSITAEEMPICEGKTPDGYVIMMGDHEFVKKPTGYTSPTMMTDHFERVHASLERRLSYENLESKAACLRMLYAVEDEYSRCQTC